VVQVRKQFFALTAKVMTLKVESRFLVFEFFFAVPTPDFSFHILFHSNSTATAPSASEPTANHSGLAQPQELQQTIPTDSRRRSVMTWQRLHDSPD
jgi:hypothetical protein